jgi:hypothetical protein
MHGSVQASQLAGRGFVAANPSQSQEEKKMDVKIPRKTNVIVVLDLSGCMCGSLLDHKKQPYCSGGIFCNEATHGQTSH